MLVFGVIHPGLGLFDEGFDLDAAGAAGGAAHSHGVTVGLDGLFQRLHHLADMAEVGVHHKGHELVAADAVGILAAENFGHLLRHDLEHHVTGVVALGVVQLMQPVHIHIDAAQAVGTAQGVLMHVVLVGVAVGDLGVQVGLGDDLQLAPRHHVVGQGADVVGGDHTGHQPEQPRVHQIHGRHFRSLERHHAAGEDALVQRGAQDVPQGRAGKEHRQHHRKDVEAGGRLVGVDETPQIDAQQVTHCQKAVGADGQHHVFIGETLGDAEQRKAACQRRDVGDEPPGQRFHHAADHHGDQ